MKTHLSKSFVRFTVVLSLAFSSAFAQTDTDSSVQAVKGGVLKFDKSITLGQAFDGYRHFTAKVWTPTTAANGRKVVEAAGTINFAKLTAKDFAGAMATATGVPPELLAGDASTLSQGATSLRNVQQAFKGAQIVFQFVLNLDDTFQLKTGKINLVMADNRVVPVPMNEDEAPAALKDIYDGNLPVQVVAVLLMGSAGGSATTAPQTTTPSAPFQPRGSSLLSPSQGGLQPSKGLK